jgi:tetratricopeptide (TPR) repeat protein
MAENSLIFAYPLWFLAVPAMALGGVGLWFLSKRTARRRLAVFLSHGRVDEVMEAVDWPLRRLRFVLPTLALVLLAVALARPLTGPKPGTDERVGADVVVALDVSKSMWADDIEPTRLAAVKESLLAWIRENRTDRIGIVLFAGEAFVLAPLTTDAVALEFVLKDAGPNSISIGGTNLPEAITTAARLLEDEETASRLILLVTDGENLEGDPIAAAREARRQNGLAISTVGVGTTGGTEVPSHDKSSSPGPQGRTPNYVRNEYGANVVSRLDTQGLRSIASVGGGTYAEFKPGQQFFRQLRDRLVTPTMEKNRKIDARNYNEWFQIPLGLAIVLMAIEPLLARARRRVVPGGVGVPVVKPVSFSRQPVPQVAALLVLLHSTVAPALATGLSARHIERAFEQGRGEEVVTALRSEVESNPSDPMAAYNHALALYRAGRQEEARSGFELAEALAESPELKAKALFQLGNIQARMGMALGESANTRSSAVPAFEEALTAYQSQLAMQPTSAGAHNLDLVSERFQRLLIEIGTEQTKMGGEKRLREAMQAFDRAAELNPEYQPLAVKARALLSEELLRIATEADRIADAADAEMRELNDKTLQQMLARRQEIMTRLEEAHAVTPDDVPVAQALDHQKSKIADLLAKAAANQAAPGLEKRDSYSGADIRALEGAAGKLEQALGLSPTHAEASELAGAVKEALVAAHVQNGEKSLAAMQESMAAEEAAAVSGRAAPDASMKASRDQKQLNAGQGAAKSFEKALGLQPTNEPAAAGLAEVQGLLAGLHADVGMADLAKAEAGSARGEDGSGEAGSGGNEQGKSPGGESGESGKGGKGGKPKRGGAPSGLRETAALLEKASTNLGAAATLQPDNAAYQQALERAGELLSNVRSELDALGAQQAGRQEGDQEGIADLGAVEGGEGGELDGGSDSSQMLSMAEVWSPTSGYGGGATGGADTKREKGRFIKDW